MNKKFVIICWILFLELILSSIAAGLEIKSYDLNENNQPTTYISSNNYSIQWEMNFGSDGSYGARYEGPQPIGDCDNDGYNEFLVGGRDGKIRIFEWDETKQTYLEMHTLFCPLYPYRCFDAGGFAIGDITNDGKNEVCASWYATIHKWIWGKYRILTFNPWMLMNGGGSADCYIGDYDTDGKNELIMSGGPLHQVGNVPEIVIYKYNGLRLKKEAEWNNPESGYTFVYMAGLGDVDDDGENEIVCGSAWKVFVLDWNKNTKKFEETVIKTTGGYNYPFACVCKDSDTDGKNEIHVGYSSPMISIFEWNGAGFETKFEKGWPGEGALIEGLDVGDVDDDGIPEVCAGTDLIHILQWNGSTYVEEAALPTFGELAVVSIGDCDNDGKNEIQAGSVIVEGNQDFMSWVFKYGSKSHNVEQTADNGGLKVTVKSAILGTPLKDASVAAWNLETKTWYDIQPQYLVRNTYVRQDLPEGDYLLRVLKEGYKIQEAAITIKAGEETIHTFLLKLG